MKNGIGRWSLVLVILLLVGICAQSVFGAPKQIVMKFAGLVAANMDNPEYATMVKFADEVNKKSKGAIKVEVYPANQLGSSTEIVQGVSMGTIDLCCMGFDTIGAVYPPVFIFNMPYLYKDIPHVQRVLASPVGKKILAEMENKINLHYVASLYRGPRHIMNSKRPIVTPADMKDMKIRVPGNNLFVSTFKALGAIPVAVDYGEVYTALSQKLVDGVENPIDNLYDLKAHEVLKYLSFTGHMQSPIALVINKNVFNGLSSELKTVVMNAGKVAEDYRVELLKANEAKELKVFRDAGVVTNEINVAAFREATKDVYKQFISMFGEQNYLDIQKIK